MESKRDEQGRRYDVMSSSWAVLEASETVGVELDELDEVASMDEAAIPVRPDIRV